MKTENQNYQLDKPEEYAENQMDVSVDKAAEKEKTVENPPEQAQNRRQDRLPAQQEKGKEGQGNQRQQRKSRPGQRRQQS